MKTKITYPVLFLCLLLAACGKDFLEKKNNKALLVPSKLSDFRALTDNTTQTFGLSPGLGVISADEFVVSDQTLAALPPVERNAYLWEKEVYNSPNPVSDWAAPYKQVFYANIVLEGLQELSTSNAEEDMEKAEIRGTALFQRAFCFFNLSQVFAEVYQKDKASSSLGIPIRLSSDVNLKSTRGTLQQTYDQVITDLKQAMQLLPDQTAYNSRPSKPAAYGLMSRVLLSMSDFAGSEKYADSALAMENTLLDYNTLDTTGVSRRFPAALPNGNPEVLFYGSVSLSYTFPVSNTGVLVAPDLYGAYHSNDLRRALFFRDLNKNGNITFRGTYSGTANADLFSGIAVDELILNKAECLARRNETALSMQQLNTLLIKRYKTGKFNPLIAGNAPEALKLVLAERKKELIGRGLRWSDLRRLNLDPALATTLKRVVSGQTIALLPGDKRYVLPIPDNEIAAFGMQQNER